MLDRGRIKEMAKTILKRRYWIALLVALLVGLLGGNLAGGLTVGDGLNLNFDLPITQDSADADLPYEDFDGTIPPNPWLEQGGGTVWDEYAYGTPTTPAAAESLWEQLRALWNETMDELSAQWGVNVESALLIFLFVLLGILAVVMLFAILFTLLVSNVMTVGGHGWMLRQWRGEDASVGEAFAAFRIYKPTVVTMLLRGIYTWLWSLLFVIPGIVKGYAYSMTPYIIYENPNLTANQAIQMSQKMTKGYKGDLFVLDLSFIGWKFLSGITGGLVGLFWANPYMGLTHAGVYEDLKYKAIRSGRLTWEDFDQQPPPVTDPFAPVWDNPAPPQNWSQPAPQPSEGQPASPTPWGNPPTPPAPAWDHTTTPL